MWILTFQCTLQTNFSPRHPGNYYGTPKPPAEPSPVQPDLVDQVLFDEEFDTEVQRKRTTSVSKMDRKDSAAPEEEEEEERPPLVNGLAGETPALALYILLDRVFSAFSNPSSFPHFIYSSQTVHYLTLSMQQQLFPPSNCYFPLLNLFNTRRSAVLSMK